MTRRRKTGGAVLGWILLFAVGLSGLPARAQEQKDEEPEAEVFVDEVFVEGTVPAIPTSNTVAAKLPLSLRETPASVSVVGSTVLEEQDATLLGDALENASGVNVQSSNGVAEYFLVRGLDSESSGLILFDGAPEPETSFYPVYNLEQVEVLKGPSAFLYGGSPLGGTVNMVRKQPVGERLFRLGGSGGSFSTVSGTLDANTANTADSVRFRVNSLWQSSDNYRDDKESETKAINPALTWRPNERTSLNFNFELVDTRYKSDAGLPLLLDGSVPGVPRTRSYQAPFDVSDQEIRRFQIDYEAHLSDRFVLRNKAYHRELGWESRGTIFNGVFPTPVSAATVFRSLLSLDDAQEFTGDQLEGLWRLSTGGVTHNLLAGVEIARQADEFTFVPGFLPPIDLFNPVETAAEPVFPIPGQSFGADARSRIVAPYVVDQITFGRLQVLAGVRHDSIDFEDAANRISRRTSRRTSRNDSELSPMLGVVFSPDPSLSFYANAGEAFAPPSTFVVGQDRVPEESRQVELGAKKGVFGDRVRLSAALYQIERENIAIPDANGITQQTGDQRSRGAELEVAAQPRNGLRAFFTYAFNEAELTEFTERIQVSLDPPFFLLFDRSGNVPAFAPEHIANLWVIQRFDGGFGIGAGGRYLSEQFIAADNAFTIGGSFTLDAALYYDWGPWQFNLNLKNVTDEETFTRGFGASSVIPAPGFATFAGFHYNFG